MSDVEWQVDSIEMRRLHIEIAGSTAKLAYPAEHYPFKSRNRS